MNNGSNDCACDMESGHSVQRTEICHLVHFGFYTGLAHFHSCHHCGHLFSLINNQYIHTEKEFSGEINLSCRTLWSNLGSISSKPKHESNKCLLSRLCNLEES